MDYGRQASYSAIPSSEEPVWLPDGTGSYMPVQNNPWALGPAPTQSEDPRAPLGFPRPGGYGNYAENRVSWPNFGYMQEIQQEFEAENQLYPRHNGLRHKPPLLPMNDSMNSEESSHIFSNDSFNSLQTQAWYNDTLRRRLNQQTQVSSTPQLTQNQRSKHSVRKPEHSDSESYSSYNPSSSASSKTSEQHANKLHARTQAEVPNLPNGISKYIIPSQDEMRLSTPTGPRTNAKQFGLREVGRGNSPMPGMGCKGLSIDRAQCKGKKGPLNIVHQHSLDLPDGAEPTQVLTVSHAP